MMMVFWPCCLRSSHRLASIYVMIILIPNHPPLSTITIVFFINMIPRIMATVDTNVPSIYTYILYWCKSFQLIFHCLQVVTHHHGHLVKTIVIDSLMIIFALIDCNPWQIGKDMQGDAIKKCQIWNKSLPFN